MVLLYTKEAIKLFLEVTQISPPRLENPTARSRNKIKELLVKNKEYFRTAKLFS
jgi:hypothetical protein